MQRWRGRPTLVTGASSGIGRAIAIRLLEHGLNVFACARRVELLNTIADEVESSSPGELIPIQCDLRKEEDILRMFETIKTSKYGGIDVCINNAGIPQYSYFADGNVENWRDVLSINVLATAICMKEALLSMKSRGVEDGHIINISSAFGHSVMPKSVIYSASKFAVNAMTEGLRQELLEEKSSIRVTRLCPQFTKTPMIIAGMGEEMADRFLKENNHLLPEDVVSAVLYVLSAPKHVQVHDITMYPVAIPNE